MSAEDRRHGRRARLLESGLALIATGGWQATTVSGVCRHAGLTARYFYENFRDRDELLVAVFDAIVTEVTFEAAAAAAAGGTSMRATVRASIDAWVKVASKDPRKGRVAFVEALGSEALMRRRLDVTRRFAETLTAQAVAAYAVPSQHRHSLDLAGLIVAGGLIETMVEWIEGRLHRSADELVEHYTELCVATVEAALRRPLGRTLSSDSD